MANSSCSRRAAPWDAPDNYFQCKLLPRFGWRQDPRGTLANPNRARARASLIWNNIFEQAFAKNRDNRRSSQGILRQTVVHQGKALNCPRQQ